MLPSKKRLNRSLFEQLLSFPHKKTVFNNIGTLKYKKAENPRFSIVISSKVEKRAVYRNLLKRRIYSVLSLFIKENDSRIEGVFYISKNATNLNFPELKKSVYELLKKTT
ncbi:MAG TPA: ribonuclease P protein component [Candidatus Paceibacterota bacterium]|nr:ribonuclease P protein component [Candidatus Paceibacterota bacterium]